MESFIYRNNIGLYCLFNCFKLTLVDFKTKMAVELYLWKRYKNIVIKCSHYGDNLSILQSQIQHLLKYVTLGKLHKLFPLVSKFVKHDMGSHDMGSDCIEIHYMKRS